MINYRFFTILCFSTIFFKKETGAQSFSFPGTRIGNYTGVQSVFFNPSHAADSRYLFDLNLFSINAGFGNNKASYSLNTTFNTFNSTNTLNNFLSGEGRVSGQLNLDILGPSLLINLNKKSGIVLSSRIRGQFSVTDIDGKLAKTVLDDLKNGISFPYQISSGSNMRINTNGWAEYGLTYGRVIKDEKDKLLKIGATIKFLAGAGNSYAQINQLSGTLIQPPSPNGNVYLAQGSRGEIGIGISGKVSSFTPNQLLQSSSIGLGLDFGLVYEKRSGNSKRHPYKYKLSLSVLDIGSIKYDRDISKSGSFNMLVTSTPGFDLQTLQGVSFDGYKQILSTNPNFTPAASNNATTITVSLPATIQLYGDARLFGNLYLSAGTQISLANNKNPENPFLYSGFTLTPRYEGRGVGLYFPINYNSLTQLTMGTTVRLGPLFFGSGSILSSLLSNSKQADFHAGLHLGILKRAKKKTDESEAENKTSN